MNLKLMSKMIIFTLLTVLLSALCIIGLYKESHTLLTDYFLRSDYMLQQEKRPIRQMQKWIDENNIRTADLVKLDNYCDEHQFPYLVIIKKGRIVYYWNAQDINNTSMYPAAPGLEINRLWKFYQPINFKNSEAFVFIDTGKEKKIYQMTAAIAIILGVSLGMIVYVVYSQKKINQIIYINDLVERLRNKDYTHEIHVSGSDEIVDLADHVDVLRQRLADDVQKEKELREENYTIISGMAHDIRHPLANIQLYVDILSGKQDDFDIAVKIKKNIRSLQILSDELFEYILLHNKEVITLDSPEKLFSAIGDDLSEMYAWLKTNGFNIDDHDLNFYDADIQVNHEYITRICNNIYSNLIKYAAKDIKMYSEMKEHQIIIGIENKIQTNKSHQSNGIGVKNIKMMMNQMNGKCVIEQKDELYSVKLIFPVFFK